MPIDKKAIGVIIFIVTTLFVGLTVAQIDFKDYNYTRILDGSGYPPLDREGAAYGNVGGTKIYFAGGVNTIYPTTTDFTAFTDIYTYDTVANTFTQSMVNLPGATYFGIGNVLNNILYIYSGRNNSGDSQADNTYFSDMYVVDFSSSTTNPTVTTRVLNPPVTPREYPSGVLAQNGLFYVFGGVTANSGVVSVNDIFFTIDVNTGVTTLIPCDYNCPSTALANPVVFFNKGESLLYVYSGMNSDSVTWTDNTLLYTFDVVSQAWLSPTVMPNPTNLVWNAWAVSADLSTLILIGGDAGTTGSVNSIWSWNLVNYPPVLTKVPATLPYPVESAVAGIDVQGSVWIFSGAVYGNSNGANALQYNHGIIKFSLQDPKSVYSMCMFPDVCDEFSSLMLTFDHVLLGLFLSAMSGLGTTLGALITFLPGAGEGNIWFVGGLGTAGGVMLWTAFRELFPSSEAYFCCHYKEHYITAATICYLVGLAAGIALDIIVRVLSHMESGSPFIRRYLCCKWDAGYEEIADGRSQMHRRSRMYDSYGDEAASTMEIMAIETDPSERMTRMGLLNTIVVILHNFPEGVATLIATLAEPTLGVALAVAICAHNIPEGFAIALPLSVGSGNKTRALLYSFVAGMASPLGAVAGWIIFSHFIGPWLFGATFGLVAGLLTYITLHELIPIAHKFDPTDKFASLFVLFGFLLMIISVLVFIFF